MVVFFLFFFCVEYTDSFGWWPSRACLTSYLCNLLPIPLQGDPVGGGGAPPRGGGGGAGPPPTGIRGMYIFFCWVAR